MTANKAAEELEAWVESRNRSVTISGTMTPDVSGTIYFAPNDAGSNVFTGTTGGSYVELRQGSVEWSLTVYDNATDLNQAAVWTTDGSNPANVADLVFVAGAGATGVPVTAEVYAIANLNTKQAGAASNKAFPMVVFEATASEEHEVLRGVYEVAMDVRLETLAHEDGAAASATTLAEHQALDVILYDMLGDSAAVEWIEARSVVRCFDIRGAEGSMEPEDDLRVSTFEVRMVCAIS